MTAETCKTMHLLVQADVDNELDAAQAAALATHLDTCPACTALHARLQVLSADLRTHLTRHTAPPSLRGRAPIPANQARRPWTHSAAFAAGLATAASLAIVLLPRQPDTLRADTVTAHIRALQPGHLVDVASTDQHTVKPWFDGRLDFAPPVHDFAAQGFALVGGRLDYLAGRPVAALVYRHDKHLIDVFVWPGDREAPTGAVRGYNVITWTHGGMTFTAVSDLNPRELSELVGLLR